MAGAVSDPLGPEGDATDGLLLLHPAAAKTMLKATSNGAFFQYAKAHSFM
jgi:hypothetical protein